MSLIKNTVGAYPRGNPGSPFIPGQPAFTVQELLAIDYVSLPIFIIHSVTGGDGYGSDMSIHPYNSDFPLNSPNVRFTTDPLQGGTFTGQFTPPVIVYTYGPVAHPATVAIAAVPATPPSQQDWDVYRNAGWNTHARSLGELVVGDYLQFTVPVFTRGALVAVDFEGNDGMPYSSFEHGLLIDLDGVHVFENGELISTIESARNNTMRIRIFRLSDGRIVYSTNSGGFHISDVTPNIAAPLFVYGLLYQADDEIANEQFATGVFYYNTQALMSGSGTLEARALSRVSMAGIGSLLAVSGAAGVATALLHAAGTLIGNAALEKLAETALSGTGYLFALAETGGMATASLPLISGIGSDTAYGFGNTVLPEMSGYGAGGFYVPALLAAGHGILPTMAGLALGADDDPATGSGTLPVLLGIGADYDYGTGQARLPAMFSLGSYGGYLADNELQLLSGAVMVSSYAQQLDLVLVLTSNGTLASSYAMTREQVLALLSQGNAASHWEVLATFGMTLLSDGHVASFEALSVNDKPDLHDNGVVWVVNMANRATSQYEQYGFNSFFVRDGLCYGVANDGIYRLDGATDGGELINALAVLPQTNMGVPQQKRVNAVYLGVASDGKMVLKIDVDGTPVVYTARSYGELKNHRVDTGKGQIGNFWQFTVMNQNGDDFNLAGIEFVPVVLGRRI